MRLFAPCVAIASIASAVQASTAKVSSYPLAVRNPYLSAWLPGNLASNVPNAEPQFWAGQNLTWPVLVRVDGMAYTVFGSPGGVSGATPASQTEIEFTSTHTIVTMSAGPATVMLDFFSPVSPNNYLRQSLPYSYLTVNVTSASTHSIQVLSGWDESWSGFAGEALASSVQTADDGTSIYFNISYPGQTLYAEKNNMAAFGSVVVGSRPQSSTLTYQYGARAAVTQTFVSAGSLPNTATSFTAANLFALVHDFGTVSQAQATFAVGYDRAHALSFLETSYSGYYISIYPYPKSAVPAFLEDYASAYQESLAFDASVVAAGSPLSTDYTDLLELSVRQIYGAMDIVIPTSSLDISTVYVFLKEISSDGDASTIDVIFPTFPALYLISPDWIRLLLEPYLIYLNTDTWPEAYIPHDLGPYPNFNGYPKGNSEAIYIEATGPFFAMLYAYAKATGTDSSWLAPYTGKLLIAGDWLVANGLYPASQLSTVDAIPATANQTGLATAAAVGLKALGALLNLCNYTTAGASFATDIATSPGLGLDSTADPTHMTYNYGLPDSWVTAFHLFPDALLSLNTFPASIASLEADWYAQQYAGLASISGGILFSYQVDFMISEWALWAGAVSDKYAASEEIGAKSAAAVHRFVTNGLNPVPFPTKFIVSGSTGIGTYMNNKARSTVGSVWAWVALNGVF